MKLFMNALYADGVGKEISGFYLGNAFLGKIANVRCTYGGGLNVYVDLDEKIDLGGDDVIDTLVIGGAEIYNGGSSVTSNLHVYL
jgi:hypothetical protein